MESPETTKNNVGLWNCPRVTKYSKETQELVQLMMQESRVSHFQQRQIHKQMKVGGALPQVSELTPRPASQPRENTARHSAGATTRPQRRSAERCRAGDAYSRDEFKPRATRDLEKEKMRLQNILATGHDEPQTQKSQPARTEREQEHEKDRFQELLEEIEERREFLEEMTALGQGKKYEHIINTEICQKIRELELIDKVRSEELRRLMTKGKEKDE